MLPAIHYNSVMRVTLYHNSRCSKSRAALELLVERGLNPDVIEYLKNPPGRDGLQRLLALLDISAAELLRKEGTELRALDESRILDAMVADPALMERPIVVVDDQRAVIARPTERILEIL